MGSNALSSRRYHLRCKMTRRRANPLSQEQLGSFTSRLPVSNRGPYVPTVYQNIWIMILSATVKRLGAMVMLPF